MKVHTSGTYDAAVAVNHAVHGASLLIWGPSAGRRPHRRTHPAEEANCSDAAAASGAGKNAAEVIQGSFRRWLRARCRAVVKLQDAWRVRQRSRPSYLADTLMQAHARSHSNYTAHNISIWRERGGGDLEPVLASGAMALVDAQWIISHAEAGGVVTHRQALPKEAFLSLADLVEASRASLGGLPVIALSCPWRTKQHPDPDGAPLLRAAALWRILPLLTNELLYMK